MFFILKCCIIILLQNECKQKVKRKLKKINKSFIPKTYNKNYDYFCTWESQNRASKNVHGDVRDVRNAINSEFLFSDDGVLNKYFKGFRENLIVVLDDGWDVPYDATNDDFKDFSQFGSLVVNTDRFPEFTGEPKERLKKLCDKIKNMGYGGVGLWVCANAFGETTEDKLSDIDASKYWRERMEWCNYAGIEYWKVDWGLYEHDESFRKMLTKTAHKYAPNLKIEHAVPQEAWNFENENGSLCERYKKVITISDYFRTYDVLSNLSTAVTLYRVKDCIEASKKISDNNCILNVEDELEISAVLGCSAGIMRHPKWFEKAERKVNALVNWHKIAPPFAICNETVLFSEHTLCDTYFFEDFEKEHWLYDLANGKLAKVVCPSVIAVDTELPEVSSMEDDLPYVVSSKNPISGAYAIGFLKRTVNNVENCEFLCDAKIKIDDINAPLGVFGKFASITLEYGKSVEGARVYIQMLDIGDTFDITDCAEVNDRSVKITAEKLKDSNIDKIDVTDGVGIIVKVEK